MERNEKLINCKDCGKVIVIDVSQETYDHDEYCPRCIAIWEMEQSERQEGDW